MECGRLMAFFFHVEKTDHTLNRKQRGLLHPHQKKKKRLHGKGGWEEERGREGEA